MSLTSLGLATEGLLDGGSKPSLHIATLGHIRYGGVIEPPEPSGGGSGGRTQRRYTPRPPLTGNERKRLEKAAQRVTAATKREIEQVQESLIDVDALEREIKRLTQEALASLPTHEPSGRKQRAPRVTVPTADFVIEPVLTPDNDIRLRILLLLGV